MKITKTVLGNALASGEPLLLRVENTQVVFTLSGYDAKMLRGFYVLDGKRHDATFHRSDVTLLPWK